MNNVKSRLFLSLMALLAFCLFISLGIWQLHRAEEKRLLLNDFARHASKHNLTKEDLDKAGPSLASLRYFPIKVSGYYDNEHSFLLSNKFYRHQLGYEVLTPFFPKNSRTAIFDARSAPEGRGHRDVPESANSRTAIFDARSAPEELAPHSLRGREHKHIPESANNNPSLLVNRGWIPRSSTQHLTRPIIPKVIGEQTIRGILYVPLSKPFVLKQTPLLSQPNWPLTVEALEIDLFAMQLKQKLYPGMVWLNEEEKNGFVRDWHPVFMLPAQHIAYAFQWFALAITTLIIYIALFVKSKKKRNDHGIIDNKK